MILTFDVQGSYVFKRHCWCICFLFNRHQTRYDLTVVFGCWQINYIGCCDVAICRSLWTKSNVNCCWHREIALRGKFSMKLENSRNDCDGEKFLGFHMCACDKRNCKFPRKFYLHNSKNFLTVCDAPCIVCAPLVHIIWGTGLAPAVEHDKCTFTPDVKGWFSPWICMYKGGTE